MCENVCDSLCSGLFHDIFKSALPKYWTDFSSEFEDRPCESKYAAKVMA